MQPQYLPDSLSRFITVDQASRWRLTEAPASQHETYDQSTGCACRLHGKTDVAAAHAAEVTKLEPTFSVTAYLATQHYKHDVDRERHEAGLRKAGLPE